MSPQFGITKTQASYMLASSCRNHVSYETNLRKKSPLFAKQNTDMSFNWSITTKTRGSATLSCSHLRLAIYINITRYTRATDGQRILPFRIRIAMTEDIPQLHELSSLPSVSSPPISTPQHKSTAQSDLYSAWTRS